MKSNKGISMITLIITIISMIILLGIAYRIGTRYISESREEERTSLISILSTSVVRRQNDKYVGNVGENLYYVGYHITTEDFEKLYENFEKKDCMYEPGLWYAIDAEKATELGIIDAEKFLIDDVKEELDEDEKKVLAVVDYYTGNVQLLKCEHIKDIIKDIINKDDGTGCEHRYTIVSCLEPSVCTKCGTVLKQSLGHEYNLEVPTCTEPVKCNRCGYIKEKALGHEYENTLSHNDEGHFNKCIRYDSCHGIGNFEKHKLNYYEIDGDEWIHESICRICGWEDLAEPCTTQIKSKDMHNHIEYCTKCLKEKETEHDSEKRYKFIDKHEHMVWCDSCNYDLYREEHIDIKKPYGICDLCRGIIDITDAPRVEKLIMENITPSGESVYWAKRGDIIQITFETSLMLSEVPTVELQGIEIRKEDIQQDDLVWTIQVDTSKYAFVDGLMSIEVSNIVSMWDVEANDMDETTDDKYVTYDSIKPEYIYIPEN